jgi:hypothetical protein
MSDEDLIRRGDALLALTWLTPDSTPLADVKRVAEAIAALIPAAAPTLVAAMADRIEALTAERDEANKRGDAWRLRADIAEVKLAKALAGLDKAAALIEDRHVVHMTAKRRNPKDYISDWSLIAKEVRTTLAEIEGEKT